MSAPKLTAAQRRALAAIVAESSECGDSEVSLGSASYRANLGVTRAWLPISAATVHALAARGLVAVRPVRGTSQRLRRGAYGRWIGGTVTDHYTELFVAPTDAGRAALNGGRDG